MCSIEMIAIDLDDTLLRDDISVSHYTKTVLYKAVERGVKIVIATGRMFQAARPWGKALGLGNVPVICYTGSMTGLCESGQIIRDVRIDGNVAENILLDIRKAGWYAQSYVDDELYVPFRDQRTDDYERQCGVKAHVAGESFWHPGKAPTKILVCEHDASVMGEVESSLGGKYGHLVNQVKSKPYFFEMNHPSCSKGNAVTALAKAYHILLDHVMTFGNGNNDVSMLSLTPWSFAVANGTAGAKKAAAHETFSNNEDGVAKAVEKYVLEG